MAWLERFDADFDNLRAVLSWSSSTEGDPALGYELLWRLTWYWESRSFADEAPGWIRALGERAAHEPQEVRVWLEPRLQMAVGGFSWMRSEVNRAKDCLGKTIDQLQEEQDKETLAWALTLLGQVPQWERQSRPSPCSKGGWRVQRAW